jgi:diaminohydroxyphosphoribosylaminopyrimidine deaminase/5-amino-6-(5-phosphoribosylamino)uracil reductase
MLSDRIYMRRALQLAALGVQGASPNPMVGAVLVCNATGLIVGEGFHRRCGGPHAEVWAIGDHKDLAGHTLYVTLEPCAHWGKTPPCARLIVERGVERVVVGCVDPFAKVSGRGIAILREASIEVEMIGGEEEQLCRALNEKFFTAHTLRRPWVTLKWAQSADGFIDRTRSPQEPAAAISTPLTRTLVHRVRSLHQAIAVGSRTALMDRPRLDTRLWPGGNAPTRVSFNRSEPLSEQLGRLYDQGIISLLVEGGATLIEAFIEADLWDALRVETSPILIGHGVAAPSLPQNALPTGVYCIEHHTLKTYKNQSFHTLL